MTLGQTSPKCNFQTKEDQDSGKGPGGVGVEVWGSGSDGEPVLGWSLGKLGLLGAGAQAVQGGLFQAQLVVRPGELVPLTCCGDSCSGLG